VYRSLPPGVFERLEWLARYGQIDMQRSLLWSEELNYAPSVRINPVAAGGGQPAARAQLLESVERALLAWRDPLGGERVVRAVHRREDLYPGPCLERAPELFLELEEPGGYSFNVLPSSAGDEPVRELAEAELEGAKGSGMPGSHRRDGIFMLQAPGLAAGELSLDIAELLPLWLQQVGLGSLLDESRCRDVAEAPGRRAVAAPATVVGRLRRLGYL